MSVRMIMDWNFNETTPQRNFTGTVTNLGSGTVSNATVVLEQNGTVKYQGTSAADGKFNLAGAAPHRLSLVTS